MLEKFLLQQDGFLLDKTRCPTLYRALNGGYRYGKTKAGQRKPVPDKNDYSHIVDALQYAAMAAAGGMVNLIASRLHRTPRRSERRISAAAWT